MENIFGTDLFGDPIVQKTNGVVAERFLIAPFTILDAKQGEWQDRKRAWLAMGIKGEEGRGERLTYTSKEMSSLDYYRVKEGKQTESKESGTSIFDPVLCELAYRWFSPKDGQVIDPFAGGSVRGIVSQSLDRNYWGCDLRKEQIEANIKQGEELLSDNHPKWVCGDSMDTLSFAPDADFIFSCPPYGDLEVYSDEPEDLSSMEWHTFVAAYKRIILRSARKLKENRFACFVVGNFRDKKGFYRDLVGETVRGFEECGVRYYNEAVLATPVASAAMRVTKQFEASRKLAKTHQNILVFCKGDPKTATDFIKGSE